MGLPVAIDEHEQRTDGRLQRSQRTRGKIRDAFNAMIREGESLPTAPKIAERAGVSLRTLWSTFGDMESLRASALQYWMDSDEALRSDIDPRQPLVERIRLFCAERERRLENIAPAAIAVDIHQMHSETLRQSRGHYQDELREDIRRVFEPEIERAASSTTLMGALAVISSWDAWHLMTVNLGMTADASRELMEFSLTALLVNAPVGS